MGFKMGIVGLLNVGKLILFNVLIKIVVVQVVNFFFCMIEFNVGEVVVFDQCLYKLVEIVIFKQIILVWMMFVDIVGLVKGVFKGEGLGNQFFVNICECDLIVYVVCCFEDGDIIYVEGCVDLVEDVLVIEIELMLVDLESIEKCCVNFVCKLKGNDKEVL